VELESAREDRDHPSSRVSLRIKKRMTARKWFPLSGQEGIKPWAHSVSEQNQ